MYSLDTLVLTYELLYFKAVDGFADKIRDFVCAGCYLCHQQFKFN